MNDLDPRPPNPLRFRRRRDGIPAALGGRRYQTRSWVPSRSRPAGGTYRCLIWSIGSRLGPDLDFGRYGLLVTSAYPTHAPVTCA